MTVNALFKSKNILCKYSTIEKSSSNKIYVNTDSSINKNLLFTTLNNLFNVSIKKINVINVTKQTLFGKHKKYKIFKHFKRFIITFTSTSDKQIIFDKLKQVQNMYNINSKK